MNAKINFAEFIRHIQTLSNSRSFTPEQLEEFEFHLALHSVSSQVLVPGFTETIVPLYLKRCSLERAKELVKPLGLHLVEGGSGTVYLSWSKGLAETNAKTNLTELIQHIQSLSNSSSFTPEQIEEFEFYLTLNSILSQVLVPGFIETIVVLPLKRCSFEKAKELAKPLGLHLIESNSGVIYLSWSKGLDAQ